MTGKEKAKKTETTTTTTVKTKSYSMSYIMHVLSYVAVCVGGVALFIAMILSKCGISARFVGSMQSIANAVAWAVVSLLSFGYIKRRRRLWMWIVWVVAVVMIVTGIIL